MHCKCGSSHDDNTKFYSDFENELVPINSPLVIITLENEQNYVYDNSSD